ncbi:MAG: nucleotidyltransferase domain-containing protein [archaeon]
MKNTDTKDKILELFFSFPTRNFHIREISRILKISPPAVSKALKHLENENLVTVEKKFIHTVQANLSNQAFKNIKRIANLGAIHTSGLFNYLHDNFPLSNITLFGSYSRGEDIEKSDIDIAIESKEKKLDLENYEKKLNRRVNIEFISFDKLTKELKESIINGIILSGYISIK